MSLKRKHQESSCSICNNLDARNHEQSTEDLEGRSNLSLDIDPVALNYDCRYCRLLDKVVRDLIPDLDSKLSNPSINLHLIEGTPASVDVIGNELDEEGELATGALFYLCTVAQKEEDRRSLPTCFGLYSLRSDTEECFSFARDSLATCLESHDKCKGSAAEATLPKRIIDVDRMKLIETAGEKGHYACLSHCWGKANIIKAEMENLADMKESIPLDGLSNVFRDAITVCRYLKMPYLWIDSLCIIQDSREDWERESAKMCDYYENADLTISAASSPNGNVPFLAAREEVWLPADYEVIETDGTIRTFYARAHRGSSIAQPIEDSGPLSCRAWVWQEAVLSKRILHYTPSELVWECASEIKTEDGAVPRGLFSMRLTQQLARCEERPLIGWHDLVGTYSIRELTYVTDRLPALSGVANKMNAWINSEYLAGLWRSNLLADLCWSIDYASNPDHNVELCPDTYLAPSWAWPSIEGPIVFEDVESPYEAEALATVEDAKCIVPGLNPYGQVSSGYLALRGRIANVQIDCVDPEDCWTYTIGNGEAREPMTADCMLSVDKGTVRRATKSEELSPFSCVVPCVLLRKTGSADEGFTYCVLVLRQLREGEYSRIGFALLDVDELFADAVEVVVRII